MKVTVGIPTYNGASRLQLLLSSIYNYTSEKEMEDITLVVVDDGTPDISEQNKIKKICTKYNANLIRHDVNKGISTSWNKLVRFTKSNLIVLFNDDIQLCHSYWLEAIKYFFLHNGNIAHISLPVLHIDPRTALPKEGYPLPDLDKKPKFSWTPNGQAFAFKQSVFDELEEGFMESLPSFYEETSFGYELAYKNYQSYLIPFPVVQHLGSQTFGLNQELTFATPNKALSMDEYRKLVGSKFSEAKIEPLVGKVYRMEYSRVLFALKWKCKDLWNKPQNEVEERLQRYVKKRKIMWLNKDLAIEEALI